MAKSYGENCTNGRDDDGDGLIDCEDADCVVPPLCSEICENGIDDDGDGLIDCDDSDCDDWWSCGKGTWYTVLESAPDPSVVTDQAIRNAIVATGLPWRVQDGASGIEMLLIPPGTFMMGCSPSLQYDCWPFEHPVHEVTLTEPFYLGRYEVTQSEWLNVMGSNPSFFDDFEESPNHPVEMVSWETIQGFEVLTGLRLPTEAEWEYACRAGTDTAYNLPPDGSDDDDSLALLGWCQSTRTYPVGLKLANNFGLHDMHGNVREWIEDWWDADYYLYSPVVDPQGPPSGTRRGCRGSSWQSSCISVGRSSSRTFFDPCCHNNGFGFRVARTP